MDAVIELKGFTLIVTDTSLSVEGPNEEACNDIAEAFLDLIKAEGGPELVTQYVQARDQLIEELEIPTVEEDVPPLEHLTEWLHANPAFVASIEDALKDHGYSKD